jgi:hypothetical protein
MKDELNQSVDHFMRAAALAAQGTSATVGPKFYAARDRVQPAAVKAKDAASSSWDSALATITPLVAAATDTVRQTGKETVKVSRKQAKANEKDARKSAKKIEKRTNKALNRKQGSGGKLMRLAVIGAVVGAGAAWVVRRRQAAQWDEYDPSEPIAPAPVGADDAAFEPADTVTTVTGGSTSATAIDPAIEPVSTDRITTDQATTDPVTTGPVTTDPVGTDTSIADVVAAETGDQTSSAQHSPKVARMASGQNTSTTED